MKSFSTLPAASSFSTDVLDLPDWEVRAQAENSQCRLRCSFAQACNEQKHKILELSLTLTWAEDLWEALERAVLVFPPTPVQDKAQLFVCDSEAAGMGWSCHGGRLRLIIIIAISMVHL